MLETVYAAVEYAKLNWASLTSWWEIHFDTDGGPESALVVKEIINAIGAAIGIVCALADNPVAGAIGAAAGGVAGALNNAIPANQPPDSVKNLADFERYVHPILNVPNKS